MLTRALPLLAAAIISVAGCGASQEEYITPSRLANGLVIILPGIEGESAYNHDIRDGLLAGGTNQGVMIHNWGWPVPGAGPLINQVDFIGNRLAGARLAQIVADYQDRYPGRPVHLVGHSGGGGVAVFSAEGLPEGRQVDGLVLLSASISSGYDLTKAIQKCRSGIVNFYNKSDAAVLGVGTTVVGNVDGMHGPSAGLIGFDRPRSGDSAEKKRAYRKVFQVQVEEGLDEVDAHGAATRSDFVARNVAPWVYSSAWPAGASVAGEQE